MKQTVKGPMTRKEKLCGLLNEIISNLEKIDIEELESVNVRKIDFSIFGCKRIIDLLDEEL